MRPGTSATVGAVPRYIVQTIDGEMEYGSMAQLRHAVEIGLVSPDALVNEEGGFYGRPAGRVVARPGAEVQSAQRTIPIPSPVPSYVLLALALLALLPVELPRLAAMFPGLPWLAQLAPSPAGALARPEWLPTFIGWPADLGWPPLAAAGLLAAAFARGLFAAAPQNAIFFGALGAYLARTDRLDLAIACFGAAAVVIALGVRRLLKRRARRG